MARMLGALCAPHVPPALLRLTWGVPAAHSPDAASGQSTQPEPSAAPQHLPGAPRCPHATPGASTLWGWLLMPVVGALGPAARLALHGDPCMGCTPVSPRCPMSPWLQCLNLASLQPLHPLQSQLHHAGNAEATTGCFSCRFWFFPSFQNEPADKAESKVPGCC